MGDPGAVGCSMRFFHVSAGVFAGLSAVALLGGCGAGAPPSPAHTTPPGPSPSRRAAVAGTDPAGVFIQLAECFRAHGQPAYPDPVQDADGSWAFPVTADRVPVPAECAELQRRSRELSPRAAGSAGVDVTRWKAFARCMRDNGVTDWPDPNADGTFTVPERLADPADERLWRPAADGPCRQYQPDGGPDIVAGSAR